MRLRTILRQQRLSGSLVIDESTYPPNASLPEHVDGIDRISIILQGCAGEASRDRPRNTGCFNVLSKAPDTPHANTFGEHGCRIFSLVFLNKELFDAKNHCCTQYPTCVRSMIRIREGASRNQSTRTIRRHISRELCTLLPTLRSAQQHAHQLPVWWVRAQPVFDQAAAKHATVSELSDRIGVHPVHLNRLCKRAFGRTTVAYLRWVRVRLAAGLLNNPDVPLAMAAARAGFHDQPHMTHAFQRELAITPRQFLLSLRRMN
ncbi:MAG: helix-turn-helix transcriptional regulator [Phycisphaerales bacterium JB043]